jgi:F-type H+-transporting ATPase subunit b
MKGRITAFTVAALSLVFWAGFACAAAAEGESTWSTWMLFWRVVNTIALLAVLVYFLKKPLVTFFAERKEQIRKDLAEAKEQRERAEHLIAEYQPKIAGMEKELEKLRADLAKAAEGDSERLVVNAERMAAAMVESAKLTAEQEVRKAKQALKDESAMLAVELAESLIRESINDDDRKRLVEEYFVKVGGTK